MERLNERAASTDLYDHVRAASMSPSERETALNALRNADAIVDAVMWVAAAAKRLIARISEKPANLKHSH